jgi:phage baseplate assembly protein W
MVTVKKGPKPVPPPEIVTIEVDLPTAKAIRLAISIATRKSKAGYEPRFTLNDNGKKLVNEVYAALASVQAYFDDHEIADF